MAGPAPGFAASGPLPGRCTALRQKTLCLCLTRLWIVSDATDTSRLETSRGNITIREATPSDVSQYRELRLHALENAPTAFSSDYQVNLNQPISFWERRLASDEYGTIFFAQYENKLIGMTGIYQNESPKTRHSADIVSVYVCPEWRGLHIAEELIEACIAWAKAREVNIVKLGVTSAS